jgi:hypothetical protein
MLQSYDMRSRYDPWRFRWYAAVYFFQDSLRLVETGRLKDLRETGG